MQQKNTPRRGGREAKPRPRITTRRTAPRRTERRPERNPKQATAERYANMFADLIGDESAPPVLRGLAEVVCDTLDCFSAEEIEGTDDCDFQLQDPITPEAVREKVPAMILKLWNWTPAHYQAHELSAPDN